VDTTQYIVLPDGTYAALDRSMTYGDVVTILLLVAVMFLLVVAIWRQRPQRQSVVVRVDERSDNFDRGAAPGAHH
jgi:hypothetical protein